MIRDASIFLHLYHVKGRPFREGIRENPTLWWGLVAASAVAFSGATDFMPELNRWLQIVEMESSVSQVAIIDDFKLTDCLLVQDKAFSRYGC